MLWPKVTILICTYNRPDEINRTIFALLSKLDYPRESLEWVICDDHSPDSYVERLSGFKSVELIKPRFSITPENRGWAANVNLGLLACRTDYIFFIEDDYILTKELDLRLGVALLEQKEHIGFVRYRGTAGEHIIYHQFEADIAASYPDYQDGVGLPGKLCYLQLDSGSPALYLYSHGAHLKHTRFLNFYGPYPEGLKLGETEEKYAHIVKDKMKEPGAPGIAMFPEWIPQHFDHIGHSYQLGSLDLRRV